MINLRDTIQDALIEIGALAVGEAMEAADAQFGLRTLNRMIERWNSEHLMMYTLSITTLVLTPGKQTYTLGTGGDFNIPRPVKTDMISVVPFGTIVEIPLRELTDPEWRAIAVKSTPSQFPTQVWFDGNVPFNGVNFWPVPTTACSIKLYSWGRILVFTDLNTSLQFPDGWEEAIVTNLALMLSSSYGKAPTPVLMQRASTSKASIQSLNAEPLLTRSDFASGNSGSIAIRSFGLVVDRS